jgi:hypothetical protein
MEEFPNLRAQRPEPVPGPLGDLPLPEPELFPEVEESRSAFLKDILPAIVMIGAVLGLGVLGWYAYTESKTPKSPEEVPIVKADPTPYKTKPQNPGGMEFANTDKAVYDMIDDKNAPATGGEKVEQVIGQPEEPIQREEIMPAGAAPEEAIAGVMLKDENAPPTPLAEPAVPQGDVPVASAPVVPLDESAIDKELSAPVRKRMQDLEAKTEPVVAAPDAAATKPVDALTAVTGGAVHLQDAPVAAAGDVAEEPAPVKVREEPVKKIELKKEPAKAKVSEKVKVAATAVPKSMQGVAPTKKSSGGSGKYKIQLGAYRSEAAATDAWKAMNKKFGKELGSLSMHVEKANLGSKGIFYRLQAGSFASEEDARMACNKLVAKKQGCLAVGG